MKQIFRRVLQLFLIFSILSPIIFITLVLEQQPAVPEVKTINTDDAVRARELIKKVVKVLRNNWDQALSISATEEDLNSIFSIGHRSFENMTGQVMISPALFESRATIRIPDNPIGEYINIGFDVSPSDSGLQLGRASIGKISASGKTARFFITMLLDLGFGYHEGRDFLDAVNAVILNDRSIDVRLSPMPDIDQRVQRLKSRFRFIRDEVNLMGDPALVRVYYEKIIELSAQIPPEEAVSFAHFIGALFEMAKMRGGRPEVENQAAILALAIYFGHWRVEQITGPIRTAEIKLQPRQTNNVFLAGRTDLRRHFIVSAALHIASEKGIAYAIGEFKELLDAGRGGSGFSFVDLAADRAGVLFAEAAVNSRAAKRVQDFLGDAPSEDQFFPGIEGLPEGLSKEVFIRIFGDVKSDRYLALVQDIDDCIHRLPAYTVQATSRGSKNCDISSKPLVKNLTALILLNR